MYKLIIMGLFLFASCKCSQQLHTFIQENPVQKELDIPDVLSSKSISVYSLGDSVASYGKICGYNVQSTPKKVDHKKIEVLSYLLQMPDMLEFGYTPVKQPFKPSVAFKPSNKSRKSLLFSLGTDEIAISVDDSTYVTYRYVHPDLIQKIVEDIKN